MLVVLCLVLLLVFGVRSNCAFGCASGFLLVALHHLKTTLCVQNESVIILGCFCILFRCFFGQFICVNSCVLSCNLWSLCFCYLIFWYYNCIISHFIVSFALGSDSRTWIIITFSRSFLVIKTYIKIIVHDKWLEHKFIILPYFFAVYHCVIQSDENNPL